METFTGFHIGMDYGHEKYVRLIWDNAGKIFYCSSRAKLEYVSYCLIDDLKTEEVKESKIRLYIGTHHYVQGKNVSSDWWSCPR